MYDEVTVFSRDVQAGLRVSSASLAWTLMAGSSAIVVGSLYHSLVLIAFGAIGIVDAVGSGSLILHFRHSLRHVAISERHERTALRLVTFGMATIGVATVGDSAYRLASRPASRSELAGILLAAISTFVLTVLARRKRRLAKRIPSHALHADGWLSAMGAVLALVVLVGTGLQTGLGWWWIDPSAAIAIGVGAIGLSIALSRGGDLE